MKVRLLWWLAAVVIALLGGPAFSVLADTHHWNGEGDGATWSDPDNWLEDEVPLTTSDGETADSAEVSGAYTVDITADVSSIKVLTITGDETNQPVVTIDPGVTLKLQTLNVVHGGLVLDADEYDEAQVIWAKANRGSLQVQSDGYIAGTGLIRTTCSTGAGVYLMSTRADDFDMTDITLFLRYQEKFRVCSQDLGRTGTTPWEDNFAIGKLILGDGRHNHDLYEADGTTGGDTNAVYCYELEFEGLWDKSSGARLNLQGTNVYVLDKITWFDDTYTDTPGQLTVATAFDAQDVTTSLWDDDTPQGEAWLGYNAAPVADAGSDQEVTDTDGGGDESITLDGSGSSDSDGSITGYVWSDGGQQIATGQTAQVVLDVGKHVITLTVTDDEDATAADTVTVWVNPQVVSGVKNWNGRGDGTTWSDADNWCEDAVPVTTSDGETADSAVISGDYTVNITADVSSIKALTITGDETNQPVVTIDPGVTLKLQTLNVVHGGLVLDADEYDEAQVIWAKANRGSLQVQSDGYIAGAGLIRTTCSTGAGVYLMSTRADDFDMTDITLFLRYQEKFRVCSLDNGRDSTGDWEDNFAIGKLILGDGRHNHDLYEADGTTGGDTNAVYCYELEFEGLWDKSSGARLNLQGTNVYVRDKVIWFDDTYEDIARTLTVATAFDAQDVTTSFWDDDSPQGSAYIGLSSANQAPVADAGDDQLVNDNDGTGSETVTLDGSGSSDTDGTITSYVWSEGGQQIATGETVQVSLATGVHTITLTVTDDGSATDADTVSVEVNARPFAEAGSDIEDTDYDGGGDEMVTLDGSGSSDSDGSITSYLWKEGQTQVATGQTAQVVFDVGSHTVTLTVTDDDGATHSDTVNVTIYPQPNQAPTADAGSDQEVTDTDGGGDETVTLDGSGSSDSDGTIVSYVWKEGQTQIATGQTAQVALAVGKHVITLEVTDDDSATDSDTVTVWVNPQVVSGVKNWNGRGDGISWSDADNWCEDAVPVTTSDGETADAAVVSGDYEVLIDVNVTSIKSLKLDGDQTDQPAVMLASGKLLKLQTLNIVHGGLILEEVSGVGANITWAKANRGGLYVQSDGFIAGVGTITTYCSAAGVQLMSTRSDAFDMTGITLDLHYGDRLRVCSLDVGRATSAAWQDNFAIGKLILGDYRYASLLFEADGSTGGDTNALYVYELEFAGDSGKTTGSRLDLQGINCYVRDKVTWFDDSTSTANQQLTVATAFSTSDPTTSLYDNDTPQAVAYLRSADYNEAPVADAGEDQTDFAVSGGTRLVTLDGSGSSDSDGTIVSYVWKEGQTQIATGQTAEVALGIAEHTITLVVTDDDAATASDTVVVTIEQAFPLALTNNLSGISLTLSGTNGSDWAVERSFHDDIVAEQIIYLKSSVEMSLDHNSRNTIMIDTPLIPHVIGENGDDGIPDTGDEGDIYYKIDRDLQAHRYSTLSGALPSYCVAYSGAFKFDTLTYDGQLDVLGTTGDNGEDYGTKPLSTTALFCYGQTDAYGNEWHTVTYWDDDEPLLADAGVGSQRLGSSDGHCVFVCVNPVTPVIQFKAGSGEQFYTTPVKTYHVPKIWQQKTYLTDGVLIHFENITDSSTIYWRVDGGTWTAYDGTPLVADDIFTSEDTEIDLDVKCGTTGTVYTRTVVMNPGVPDATESHGNLLWADASEKSQLAYKVHNTQPFKHSYDVVDDEYYQNVNTTYTATRGSWRSGAGMASTSLSNAFVVAVEGPTNRSAEAAKGKERLLRMARLQPVGFETSISNATPSKDFLNELGQTLQQFADAGLAYDLMASCYRDTQATGGMTPIEEIAIRDGLAKIAKNILQYRSNYSATSGGGDTHWAHGYELSLGIIALSMPKYKTEYYGVSGGDRTTVNNLYDASGKYWNPFPDQGVTWYECATDPEIDTPGHPGVRYPFRAEFLYTEDGWWDGPNYMQGDGDRYFDGPLGNRLVGVTSGGLANAECRTELVEMHGYESPFVTRTFAFDYMRRLKGDSARPLCTTNYIRRLLMNGHVPLSWDSQNLIYTTSFPRIGNSLCAFNDHYEFASLTEPGILVDEFLTNCNIYYGYESGSLDSDVYAYIDVARKNLFGAYPLSLCWDPDDIGSHQTEPNHLPILKPLFKHVVEPGEDIYKEVIAIDPDGNSLTVSVSGLPTGATWDSQNWLIEWSPGTGDEGAYRVTVTADDGSLSVSRPFMIVVMQNAGDGPVPAAPTNFTATFNQQTGNVDLAWNAPSGVTVDTYLVYREGILWRAVDGNTTSLTDSERISPLSHTRYHVAAMDEDGHESSAAGASPSYLTIPDD